MMEEAEEPKERIKSAVSGLTSKRENALPALQEIQNRMSYIPKEALEHVSKEFNLPRSRIYEIASFYSQFHFEPQGKHAVKVCEGTACHVKGADDILATIEKELGIDIGEVTDDNKFSLESVRCLGCCSLAPVMMIDGEVYGNLTEEKVRGVLEDYR